MALEKFIPVLYIPTVSRKVAGDLVYARYPALYRPVHLVVDFVKPFDYFKVEFFGEPFNRSIEIQRGGLF